MIWLVFYVAKQMVLMLFYIFKAAFRILFRMLEVCAFLIYCFYMKIKEELKKNEEAKLLKIAGQSDIFET